MGNGGEHGAKIIDREKFNKKRYMLVKDLQPKAVWEQFDALTRVPRPSKKEERVIEFLIEHSCSCSTSCSNL